MPAPLSSYLNTDKTGVRKYLNDQGYQDNQIGYNNGAVSLNGKSFMNATPEADGSTYASRGSLQDAMKQYSTADNTSKVNSLNNDMYKNVTQQPFQFKQQQSPFAYDPNSDQAYQAAIKSAQSNIQTGQNNTIANLLAHGQGNSSYAATASQQVANREMGNVSNNILPSLIQQSYQRYKDQNASDYQNQLANYNSGQDQLKNQASLSSHLNGLGQQEFTNNLATNQDNRAQSAQDATFSGSYDQYAPQKQEMAANSASWFNSSAADRQKLAARNQSLGDLIGAKKDANGDWTMPQAQRTLAGQQADNTAKYQEGQLGIQQQNADSMEMERQAMAKYREAESARQYALANGQIGNARQGNNNYAMQNLMSIWEKTGVAPQGIPGVEPGMPLYNKSSSSQNNNSSTGELVSSIEQMTPDMKQRFFKEQKSNIIAEHGVAGYNQMYNMYFDKNGEPK